MSRQSGLPALVFNWSDIGIRKIAENVWHAQMAGWPRILTYDAVADQKARRVARLAKRHMAMRTPGEEVPPLLSRDEYPFACTREHSGVVWVGHVPPEQNSRQGGMIAAFLARHHATDGFRFEVVVTMDEAQPK